MKFDISSFSIKGVSKTNALTILILTSSLVGFIAFQLNSADTNSEQKNEIDLGMATTQKTKKTNGRKTVKTNKNKAFEADKGTMNDQLDWDSEIAKNDGSLANVVSATQTGEFVNEMDQKSNDEQSESKIASSGVDAEKEAISRLLNDLNDESSATNSTVNPVNRTQYRQQQASASYQRVAPAREPERKETRRKKRIFSEGSGEIYANNRNSRSGKTNNTTSFSANSSNIVEVKIHGDYDKVTNRSKITVRTTKDCIISGRNVPLGTFLTGITSFSNNRLDVQFTALYLNNEIIPVRFQAYSQDGLKGIFIEGGTPDDNRQDLTEDIVEETSSEVDIPVPVVGNVIKSFIRKKNGNRKIYVHLPSNYPLLLKTE